MTDLMRHMAGKRTLHVRGTDEHHVQREASPRALDDLWESDLTRADLDRERGLNSDDEEYVHPRSQQQPIRAGSNSVQMSQAPSNSSEASPAVSG